MKKIIYNGLLLLTLATAFTACEDETSQDDSRVTYYGTLELKGDKTLLWDKGKTYEDPGYTATLKGADATAQVKVNGSVDVNTPGIYTLTYTITNEDGFSTTDTRNVLVADPTDSPITSGFWSSTADSYRVSSTGTTTYGGNYTVTVLQLSPGEFYVSDFLGGWYDQRAGYGTDYAMVGKFKLNSDNTITLEESSIAGWGDGLVALHDGKYDPATGRISWDAEYVSSMHFHLTLTKD